MMEYWDCPDQHSITPPLQYSSFAIRAGSIQLCPLDPLEETYRLPPVIRRNGQILSNENVIGVLHCVAVRVIDFNPLLTRVVKP